MSSGGDHEYGYDGEDMYNPDQYGARSHAGRDGYAPSSYAMNGGGYHHDDYSDAAATGTTPRRRSSAAALDDYYKGRSSAGPGSWGEPGAEHNKYSHELARRNKPMQRGRAYEYDDDYSSEDDDSDHDRRGRHGGKGSRGNGKDSKRGRSLSAFGKRVSSYFGPMEHNDGKDNNDTKKWGATLAGALAGGLVGRMANKNTVAPAALGAFIGGFVAREGEKKYYRRREVKEKMDKKRETVKYGAD